MNRFARRGRDFVYWRTRRLVSRVRLSGTKLSGLWQGARINREHELSGPVGIDPRITYPCYKSLDDHVDLEQLLSLDGFLTERVQRYLSERRTYPFYTGSFKRGLFSRARPGSQVIDLSRSKTSEAFENLDDPDDWEPSEHAADFEPLMRFIETLPFERRARMLIMADDAGHTVTGHRDHHRIDDCHEFIWFRTNKVKPFWVSDVRQGEKRYIASHTAWFDTVNQYHGCDATDRLAISVRVDGRFTPAFRALIPEAPTNPASRPALWACTEGEGPIG